MAKFIDYLLENKLAKSRDTLAPLDETECIHIDINDDMLSSSKILCYNASQTVTDPKGKEIPVNPKKFPTKAVIVQIEPNGLPIQIYFDTKSKCWNSAFKYNGKRCCLTPDQFESFFNSDFYQKLLAKLQKIWPLSDTFHKELYDGISNKQLWLSYDPNLAEAAEAADDEDPERPKFSASGRKIMNFVDSGVSSKGAVFYCWPDLNKVYNWSTWKDWKKIRPLCRMRFKYKNDHEYTLTLSTVGEDYKNRGFRGIDITEQPPVQWLSKVENEDVMKLSLVNKFIRHCIKKIETHLALDPEEIYSKINNPDKITVEEIRNTQSKIRNTLNEIIKKHKSDSFKWRR